MTKPTVASLKDKLLQPGFKPSSAAAQRFSDPIADTPMEVTLDEVLPWDDNPRTTRNPLYDEIKASIRARGLDSPPSITRRPGEEKYRIRNGGNTRLAIMSELFRETGDERYYRFKCLFRPWDTERGEIIALTGHLAENDLQGKLLFIERAVGVDKAKALYEQEVGKPISQSELARRLSADGYPVSQPHISKMQDTIRYLLPAIPGILYSGLGKHQVEKLLSLRKTASQCWERHNKDEHAEFEMLFQEVLAQFEGDAEEFLLQRFQDELIAQMKAPLGMGYEAILLDITQNQDQLRRSTPVLSLPQTLPPSQLPGAEIQQPLAPPAPNTAELSRNTPGNMEPSLPSIHSADGGATPPPTKEASARQQRKVAPPPLEQMTQEERQARIDGHVASLVTTSPRVLQMKQKLAALDGETLPDFNANALVAIPVQAGGLHPISDLWYIERDIDTPDVLRQHIAELAREIASSVNAPGEFVDVAGGIGFSYRHPAEDIEVTATAQHTLTLLQSLSGSMGIALKMLEEHPEQKDALGEFEFAAGLGQILLGQPLAKDQNPDDSGRLSDGALVKLFRIVRLARRLIDLEIQAFNGKTPPTDS
ncbi:transcriptional regulator [Pseudomonas sp. PIC25]|uniref:ParB family protein n=1 Tax=Pseudomonas sp. PIC25 TaxID=1958773 RepID=UPI000BAC1127|nr:ParB family protein [Pseudomonas sp. PIC25]PAU63295.1 transcriptional regulator [Pseudomonas sp. PIC25]